MTYAAYRERGFSRYSAFIGAAWWKTGLFRRHHVWLLKRQFKNKEETP